MLPLILMAFCYGRMGVYLWGSKNLGEENEALRQNYLKKKKVNIWVLLEYARTPTLNTPTHNQKPTHPIDVTHPPTHPPNNSILTHPTPPPPHPHPHPIHPHIPYTPTYHTPPHPFRPKEYAPTLNSQYAPHTLFENYSKCRNCMFEFWHFPPTFVLLKLTCLVTLFDRKIQVFKNSPKWTIFGGHF